MLDIVFKQAGSVVRLDSDRLRERTDMSFVRAVESKIDGYPIKGIRMHGDRRNGFMYFDAGSRKFSFAYDKNEKTLIFSEIVRGKWDFVVGWRDI